jgi:syntaxin 6
MHNELDDQAILLDDLGREMDTAETRLDTVMKKVTKLLHMSSGRCFQI